jgi:hypothetical protein
MTRPWYNHPPEIGLPMLRRLVWNKSVSLIALAIAAVVSMMGVTAPAHAVAPVPTSVNVQTVLTAVHVPNAYERMLVTFPYTGKKFQYRWICVQNNVGTTWAIDTIDNYFESGSNTVVLTDLYPGEGDPTCSQGGFYGNQILVVSTYNSADSTCYQLNLPYTANGVYQGTPVIGMNVNASAGYCRSTLQRRNNTMSQALGQMFGLANFYSATSWQASIMNNYNDTRYNYAGSDDRNALYNLY